MKKEVIIKRVFEVIDFNDELNNFTISFKELTKKYGMEYIVFCQSMWGANENIMSEDEFMKINGDMPKSFFENTIKNK